LKTKAWLLATVLAVLFAPAASAQAAGGVSGVVTAVGGGPLEGVSVCALGQFPSLPACETTDASGEYAIEELPAGKYRVKFEGGDDYVDRWFEDAATEFEAELLSISGHLTEGVDAELPPAGQIEGTVTDAGTEAAVENVSVCARREGSFLTSGCASTDPSGNYRIGGLPAGEYTVEFTPGFEAASRDYLHQYYDHTSAEGETTAVPVSPGNATASIDAALEQGARIAGTVTDEAGEPVEDVTVCAEVAKARFTFGECATTGADGTYTIHRIRSGKYIVRFAHGPTPGNYLNQYFDDEPSRKLADPVEASAPGTVSGIDAQLHAGGRIEGTITDQLGAPPIQNARACAFEIGAEGEGGQRCGFTAADGTYAIESLPTGSYEVVFSAADQGFGSERWNDQPVDETGTPVAVTAGATVTGIDGALSQGGTIGGTVTSASDDSPIQSIEVCAFRGHQEDGRCAFTTGSGDYEFTGLDAGSYAVRFRPGTPFAPGAEPSDPNYVTQWYSGQASRADSQQLDVTSGSLDENVDAAMVTGSRIAGTVTGPGDVAIPFAFVCAIPSAAGEERCINANKHGEYTIQGLSDGLYEVSFRANPTEGSTGWLPQWWNGQATGAAAEEVEVSGGVIEEIDAQLQPAGGIAGRVTVAGSGAPLGGAFICAIPDGATEATNCAEARANGRYLIPTLPSGSYRVEFSSIAYLEGGEEVEEFAKQFYKGAGSLGASTVVSVIAGSTTGSIDAAMSEPGSNPEPPDGGGGDQPSGNPPVTLVPPSAPIVQPKPVARKPRCHMNQRLKKVRGKWHCVKKKQAKPRHKQGR
jgi:5-hydroxyisourate hydrolase-like protein (transthyretin family)